MRKVSLENGEYYHVYNRGVDKRKVFLDSTDYFRFLRSLREFNQVEPVVSLYVLDQIKRKSSVVSGTLRGKEKLVEIVAYNLISNHFHLILRQLREGGISEFMRRIGNGYTRYFNHKNERSGALFQGGFKAVNINSNEQLIYLSAYVNGNHKVHGIKSGGRFSSLAEYFEEKKFLCNAKSVLCQFSSTRDYLRYVENTVKEVSEVREDIKRCLIE